MNITIEAPEPGTTAQTELCDWLRANNINPDLVSSEPPLVYDDGDRPAVRFTEFLTVDGVRYFTHLNEPGDDKGGFATADRSAPITVPPPAWATAA